jgi:hypothetical protein
MYVIPFALGVGYITRELTNVMSYCSHENQFLLAGLKVEKLSSWTERQAAYLSATKAFLAKLKPDFTDLPIAYVKAIRHEPKLMLTVECPKAKQ